MIDRTCVVVATYNGEHYIDEQLRSIESCLTQNDVILVVDDGSTDATINICQKAADEFNNLVIKKNDHNLGVAKNFMVALYSDLATNSSYVAFADQDDFWLPDKIMRAKDVIKDSDHIGHVPILYYSNVHNYDANLENMLYSACDESLGHLIQSDWFTGYFYSRALGCTYVMNSSLVKLLNSRMPEQYPRLHDGWAHSVAMLCGKVLFDCDYSGIKRRISSSNLTRPKVGLAGKIREWRRSAASPFAFEAGEIIRCYGDLLTDSQRSFVSNLEHTSGSISARRYICKYCCPNVEPARKVRFHLKTLFGRL